MERKSKTMPIMVKNIRCAWYYTENRLNSQVILLIPRGKDEQVTVLLKESDKLLTTPDIELMENYKTHKRWAAVRMWIRNTDFPLWYDMRDYCMSLIHNIIIHKTPDNDELQYWTNIL